MTRDLCERAVAAIEEARRLVEQRRQLFEQMTDIAVHRGIVAQDAQQCLHGAEQRLVRANARRSAPVRRLETARNKK